MYSRQENDAHDIHDIVDDDIHETAIEPIQNSRAHHKIQNLFADPGLNQYINHNNFADRNNYLGNCSTPPLLMRDEMQNSSSIGEFKMNQMPSNQISTVQ